LVVGALAAIGASNALAGDPGYDIDALNPEQAELANRMLAFVDRTEAKHFEAMERLNGQMDIEQREFSIEDADYDIRIVRGDVIEKGALTISVTTNGVRPYTEPATWSRVIQVNIHPRSPLAGYLHAFVAFSYDADGSSSIGGWMDFVSGAVIEEDVAAIKQSVDRVLETHDVDATPYRKAACTGQRRQLQNSCAGVSFYAPPFMEINEQTFAVVTETFAALYDAFITVVEKRMNEEYDAKDLLAQEAMRRRWIIDQMVTDPYAQNVIPYEVRSFQNFPPSVKY
jgi:coproporphyrinogen III oxidase